MRDQLDSCDGALRIRGLGISNAEELGQLCVNMGMSPIAYEAGTGVRPEVAANHVLPASYEPANWNMELHGDMCYWPEPPHVLFFLCEEPPPIGGETPMMRSRDVWCALRQETRDKLERVGLLYEHHYPDEHLGDARHISWQKNIARTRVEAEKVVEGQMQVHDRRYGTGSSGWQWEDDGGLTKWEKVPCLLPHPITGRKEWTNTLVNIHGSSQHAYPIFPELHDLDYPAPGVRYLYTVKYGDASEIEPETIAEIRATQWEASKVLKYQAGDLMILDNYTTMHGRLAYEGQRKLWFVATHYGAEARRTMQ
jgi:hypothetical protein